MKQERIKISRYLLGVIGYPLEFTLSPLMHEAALRELNLPWRYLSLPVEPVLLESALEGVRALPFIGVNITNPYKEKTIQYMDKLEGDAKILSAVNLITVKGKKLIGYNCDTSGIYLAIKNVLTEDLKKLICARTALLFGAGGAARAAALALKRLGVTSLMVINRTVKRGRLFAHFCKETIGFADVEFASLEEVSGILNKGKETGIIVSAVPAKSITLPLWHNIVKKTMPQICCELAYDRSSTLFEQCSINTPQLIWVGGREVLLHQGTIALELWTEQDAPFDVMRNTLT